MLKIPAILFLLLSVSSIVFSQRTITGRVVSAATGEPIPGSSVFISNSSKGTTSDKQGYFELTDLPGGKNDLIVSSIGYETTAYSFSAEQLPLKLKFEMSVKVRELQNVTVEPSVEEGWDKWGKMFTENFIGSTPNGIHCKIKNYKAIKFRYFRKSNRVIAYCDEPIVLENKALGYILNYQLEDFEVNFKEGSTAFAGYPYFEEIDKSRKGLQKRWQKNREKAYYGSMMQFMRSLYSNTLAKDGFEVRRMVKVPNLEKQRVKKIYRPIMRVSGPVTVGNRKTIPMVQVDTVIRTDSNEYYQRIMQQKDEEEIYGKDILTADSIIVAVEGAYKVGYFNDYLYVTYKNETEDKEYLQYHRENRSATFQRSYIWLRNGSPFSVDANGNYSPPQEIFFMAYWGWCEKIGDMLPLDFEPGK